MKLLALAALCSTAAVAQVAPPWDGAFGGDAFLKSNGVTLRDHAGTGKVVQLRGVNLGGWLEWQDWMCPIDSSKAALDANPGHNGYDFEVRRLLVKRFGSAVAENLIAAYEDAWITAHDLDNIRALGLNAVRLTLAYDTLLNEDGTWRGDAFKRADWLVQNAWARGIYTIIDYHAFLPPAAAQRGSATGYWADARQKEETVRIWSQIAAHYRGNPAVAMYDLLNEPNNSAPKAEQEPKATVISELYDKIYHAIRAADPGHAIAMEGMWDWRTLRDPRRAGYQNFVCSLHWYHFGQKDLADNDARTDADLNNAGQMQAAWRVPCLIGEFNLFGDAEAWRHALKGYDAAGLSWTMWTYKNKAGGDNSWGLYTTIPGKSPPVPNLTTDSAADIRTKWHAWTTDSRTFALNPMLGPVIKETAPH